MTKKSRKGLLVLELCILIAFFIFAAITSTLMFMKASETAQNAEALNKAVVKTTSIAETLKASEGDLAKTGARLGGKASYTTEDDQLLLYLDASMTPATPSSAVYIAKVQKEKKGLCNLYQILIKNNEDSTVIYSLDFKGLQGGGGSK